MKAAVYTKYGTADELLYLEVAQPVPAEDEVLVRVRASSINYGDAALLKGRPWVVRLSSGLRAPKYQILGGDIAGEVVAVGSAVTRFAPGDEVIADNGAHGFGAYAEYAAVPETALAAMPARTGFPAAATIPQAAVVALQGLRDNGGIQSGQRVLINGASGGIGTFAVQLARLFGAEVTAVCSATNLELARSLGAAEVIDYRKQDFTQGDRRYDLIFDIVANRSVTDYAGVLNNGGSYVACAFNATSLIFGPLISRRSGKRISSLVHKANAADLALFQKWFEAGEITAVIDCCFPLADLAAAMRYYESGRARGKIAITMD